MRFLVRFHSAPSPAKDNSSEPGDLADQSWAANQSARTLGDGDGAGRNGPKWWKKGGTYGHLVMSGLAMDNCRIEFVYTHWIVE